MKQTNKIYLASFLKNQTYFIPIMIIFFQDLGLSYSEIFWIFTIGSIFSFIIEIPTGIISDIYSKRKSIILSKLTIFLSFIAFGFSSTFHHLILANLLYELGKSFRSGTETAYVYDYLSQTKNTPTYTHIKSHQKFYARISESIATAIGGIIAVQLNFNYVFLIASIPALINFLQTLTWVKIKENPKTQLTISKSLKLGTSSLKEIFNNKYILNITLNILIFTGTIFAIDKFIQPYMSNLNIPLSYFGFIYSAFLIIIAFLVRYSSYLEDRFGTIKTINTLTLISFIPLLILGLGFSHLLGVFLFFFIIMVENIRSPIANNLFHQNVQSSNRSTMGSILEIFKSTGKLIILPITGYLADFTSMSFTIYILSFVILANGILFWIQKKH